MIKLSPFVYVFLLHLFTISWCISQSDLDTNWEIFDSSELTNGQAEAWAVGSDVNGNIYWGVNKNMPGIFQTMDAFIAKINAQGEVLWNELAYADLFHQQSYLLKVTDSIIYLGGRTCSSIGIENCDALLVKVDPENGFAETPFIWDAGFGYEEIDGIVVEPDGIILSGWTAGKSSAIDVLLMKIDHDGEIIWQKSFGSYDNRDDHQDGHIVADETNIFIAGLYNGSAGLGWDGKALLAKFNKLNGSLVDSITFGNSGVWFNAENALGMATDGESLFLTGYTTPEANNWEIFVAKFDKDLHMHWIEYWGGALEAESARAITVAKNGHIYIAGTTKSFGNGGEDLILLEYDTSGNLISEKLWGGIGDDHVLDIYVQDTLLYLTGKTNSFNIDGDYDAFLIQSSIHGIISSSANESTSKLTVFPNPSSSILHVRCESINRGEKLTISNLFGQQVFESNCSDGTLDLNISNFPTGFYTLKIIDKENKIQTTSFFINR